MPSSKTTEQFIKEAQEIFGDQYDYSITVYEGARSPITYICKKHGKVVQSYATNHLRGKGCRKCRTDKVATAKTKTYESFLKEARETHKNLYKYPTGEYVNRKTKISILCTRCNKNFLQSPGQHLSGHGCNTCNRIRSTWQKELIKKNFRKINKKFMFVYRTTNLINEKIYIGQHSTNNLKDGYKGSGLLISKAFKKYGKDNFKFEIIESSDSREYLDQLEKKIIAEENALDDEIGYNLHQGGLGGSSYKKINQYKKDGTFIKTWDAIILASQELNLSYKTIQNCVKEVKPSCGGYIWKDYAKYKECINIQAFKDNSIKRVNQYSIEGNFIKTWTSITEAGIELSLNTSSIGKCCRQEPSTYQIGGFIWRYSSDVKGKSDIPPVDYNKSKRKVEQYALDGTYLKTFDSLSLAAKEINGASGNIGKCCIGKRKSVGGYIWKYVEGNSKDKIIKPYDVKPVKKINQYSLEGKYIKTWDSTSQASQESNLSIKAIPLCARGISRTSGGFMWRYSADVKGESDIPSVDYNKSKRKVEQYALDGTYLKTFDSLSFAAKEINGASGNIGKCCIGKRKSVGGYIWKYKI
jgi:hypothetical protein